MLLSSPADSAAADPAVGAGSPEAEAQQAPDERGLPDTTDTAFLETIEKLFSDLADIREVGVMASIVKEPITDLANRQKALYEDAVRAIGERFEGRRQSLAKRETELRAESATSHASLKSLLTRRDSLLGELRHCAVAEAEGAEEARGDLRLAIAAREQNLRAQRRAEELEEFERNVERAKRQGELAELRGEGVVADEGRGGRLAQRRREVLEEDLAVMDRLLGEARDLNHALQLKGFTRNIARFLNWSSMLSFVGIGIVLAHLFAGSFPQLGVESAWVARLRSLLSLDGTASVMEAFGRYTALLASGWLAAALAIGATISILHFLTRNSRQSDSSRDRGHSDVGAWASIFGLPAAGVGENLPTVDRKFLLQVIAILPVLFVGAVIAFFWVMTSDPSSSGQEVDPTAFHLVYLGSLYAVMSATAGTLFWLYVIRPRLAAERIEIVTALFYSVSFLAPIAGLFVLAWSGPTTARGAIAFVGAALLLTAGAAGHGIYLKGLFAREAYLEKVRYRAFAVLFGGPRLDQPKQRKLASQERSRLGRLLDRLWGHVKREPKQGDLTDANIRSALRHAKSGVDSVERVNASQSARVSASAKRESVEGELAVVSAQIRALEVTLGSLIQRVEASESAFLQTVEQYDGVLIRLHARYDRAHVALTQAYALGQLFKVART